MFRSKLLEVRQSHTALPQTRHFSEWKGKG